MLEVDADFQRRDDDVGALDLFVRFDADRALKAVNRRVEFELETGVSDRTDLRTVL
jgi:hypothetical protein